MAYDPKAYLQQALKSGFQDIYTPASNIDDSPRYEGSEARFGDVVVRPLSEFVGQSEQDIGTPQQTGYAVSSPLSGKYAGYFRNDLYDNEGNFLRTTISEPDTDKYGFKQMAQMGLMAAGLGGFGPVAQGLSKAASGIAALKSGDPLRILSAAANIPGAGNLIPAELKTLMDYAGKAGQVQSALKGDPNAIFGLIKGLDTFSGKSKLGDFAESDITPDFFAPGGEGFDTSNIPDYIGGQTDQSDSDAYIQSLINSEAALPPDLDTTPAVDNETAKFLRQQQLAQTGESPLGGMGQNAKSLPLINLSDTASKVGGNKTTTTSEKQSTPFGLTRELAAFLLGQALTQKPKEKEEMQAAEYQPFDRELMYGLRG